MPETQPVTIQLSSGTSAAYSSWAAIIAAISGWSVSRIDEFELTRRKSSAERSGEPIRSSPSCP